jgi:hypothetical protein
MQIYKLITTYETLWYRIGYLKPPLMTLLLISCSFITSSQSGFAQTPSNGNSIMKKTTSGGSLDVVLQPLPTPVVKSTQTSFKITFDQKGSSNVQLQIDYDVIILKDGKQLFQATSLVCHPGQPLHTAEGVVTIPYPFQQPGGYSVNVMVYGILFNPINPESAQFQINVA